MEFFRYIDAQTSETRLQRLLTLARLPRLCAAIDSVLDDQESHGEIYCLWGQFSIRRELIRDGLRFSLPNCPNALAWTVTRQQAPEGKEQVSIHCTINRERHDPDFVESIELFVDEWKTGLDSALASD